MKVLSILLALFYAGDSWSQVSQKIGSRASGQNFCLQSNISGTATDALCIKGGTSNIGLGTNAAARQFHILSSGTAYGRWETSTSGQYAGVEYINPGKTWTVGVEGLADSFVVTDAVGFGSASNYAIEIPKATSIPKFRNGLTLGTAGNTLSTYVEGSCTGGFSPGTGSYATLTYSSQGCSYVRVGRIVYIRMDIQVSAYSAGTAGGQITVTFTSAPAPATSGSQMQMQMTFIENMTYPANSTQGGNATCTILPGNGNKCFPYATKNSNSGTTPAFDSTSLSASTRLAVSGTYLTD